MSHKQPSPLTFVSNIASSSKLSDAHYAALDPPLHCPNCGQLAEGLHDSQETLPPPKPTKFNQLPVAGITSQQVGPAVMTWRVAPCGCQVNLEWAGSFGKEMASRKEGHTPMPLKLDEKKLAVMRKELETIIADLMAGKDKCEQQCQDYLVNGHSSESLVKSPIFKKLVSLERSLIMRVDQLQKLCPGTHNKLPKTSFSPDSTEWAKKNNMTLVNAAPVDPASNIAKFADAYLASLVSKATQVDIGNAMSKPSLVGSLATAGETEIKEIEVLLPPYVALPSIGEGIQDEHGNFLGFCSAITTVSHPGSAIAHKVRILVAGKGTLSVEEVKILSATKQAAVKQTPAKSVAGPEVPTPRQRADHLAERYGVGQRQRVSRFKRKKRKDD